jgi:hypothetical protein
MNLTTTYKKLLNTRRVVFWVYYANALLLLFAFGGKPYPMHFGGPSPEQPRWWYHVCIMGYFTYEAIEGIIFIYLVLFVLSFVAFKHKQFIKIYFTIIVISFIYMMIQMILVMTMWTHPSVRG